MDPLAKQLPKATEEDSIKMTSTITIDAVSTGILESKEPDVTEVESKDNNMTAASEEADNTDEVTSLTIKSDGDGGSGDGGDIDPFLSPRSLKLTLIRQISDSLAAPWELTKGAHSLGEDAAAEEEAASNTEPAKQEPVLKVSLAVKHGQEFSD